MEEYVAVLKQIQKGDSLPAYFCVGQNRYFLEKFLTGLKESVFGGKMIDFNYEVVDAASRKIAEVIDSANQLPVFSQKRVVLVENFKPPKGKDLERLKGYLASPSSTTILVFKCRDPKIPPGFSRSIGNNAKVINFKDPYERQLPYIIKQIASSYDKTIDPGVSEYFINFVGNDLTRIDSEISKLSSYLGDKKKISTADIDALVSDTKVETIFGFIDSISGRNIREGLKMLEKIIRVGEVPVRIISMLARHYRILWKVKKGMSLGLKRAELASSCGVSPYFLPKYIDHSKNFSFRSLARVIGLLAKADVEFKTINIPKKLLLEKLCFDLVSQ